MIFAEFLMKRTSRRLFFHEMIYFLIRQRYFGDRVRKERSGRPLGGKKDDSIRFQMFLRDIVSKFEISQKLGFLIKFAVFRIGFDEQFSEFPTRRLGGYVFFPKYINLPAKTEIPLPPLH